ncbi:sentrin-specific protease 6-like [Orbicella faveolata]|uniref:sentrin-specific protease 6-like n=1 Tax=Orbicella faveolata TaxID=48498 RepID=UPI0009E61CEC|nr:sentrin-specific protease 6-like [Orbicella faveolata]
MLGQDVRLGTLACTATKPLRIDNDEIKLDIDYDNKNCSLTILGKDLNSFKIYTDSHPGMIVLGVTPGYALKLRQRISNKGSFINPGSAVAAERDIVLEVSEHIKPEVKADLLEWVTDKLSKDFAELSIKEVERIMSYKTPSPSVSKQNQSSEEVSSPPMTTRSRTYSTRTNSSKQSVIVSKKLIVYPPPPQTGGITVTTEDIACLDSGEFLNDVIIDFYLKFVFFEKLKPEDRARTHILSSFFYKRLTQRNNSNNDTFTSTPDRMHSQVRTWTKNVDIFEKDFVIVPINESSHWYLAVICFAGQENPAYVNEINDDEETDTKGEATDTETGTEEELERGDYDDDEEDFDFSPLAALRKKPVKRQSKKSLSKQIIKSQPCILVFDSLGGSRTRCMLNLRNYLKCEWRERKKEPASRIFDKDTIKGNHPKVPQQDNFCDCGVYVLQYMESFFEDPITDFTLPIRKPNWFSSITQKRTDIRQLIYTLKASAEIDGVS